MTGEVERSLKDSSQPATANSSDERTALQNNVQTRETAQNESPDDGNDDWITEMLKSNEEGTNSEQQWLEYTGGTTSTATLGLADVTEVEGKRHRPSSPDAPTKKAKKTEGEPSSGDVDGGSILDSWGLFQLVQAGQQRLYELGLPIPRPPPQATLLPPENARAHDSLNTTVDDSEPHQTAARTHATNSYETEQCHPPGQPLIPSTRDEQNAPQDLWHVRSGESVQNAGVTPRAHVEYDKTTVDDNQSGALREDTVPRSGGQTETSSKKATRRRGTKKTNGPAPGSKPPRVDMPRTVGEERPMPSPFTPWYIRGNFLLRVSALPTTAFPPIHTGGPYDHLRYILPEKLLAYDRLPPGTACMIDVFGQGSLGESRLVEIQHTIQETIAMITGDLKLRVEKPEHAPDGQSWDAPTVWTVLDTSPKAHTMLHSRVLWDTSAISFRIVPRAPYPPLFLFAVTVSREKTVEEINAQLCTALLTGDAFQASMDVIADDPNSTFASPTEGAVIIACSAYVTIADMGGTRYLSANGPAARIYCDPPTLNCDLWTSWRKRLMKTALPFAIGPVRKGIRCKMCHGTDHTTHLCDYNKKKLPGWEGRIISEAVGEGSE
ncbi:hypothetical protein C2E23DRAFT_860823 [Lenzites betulinus]|nr:hypothetical protein C2E23DRAFT_860823 [Lenzites betulinus]